MTIEYLWHIVPSSAKPRVSQLGSGSIGSRQIFSLKTKNLYNNSKDRKENDASKWDIQVHVQVRLKFK